MLASKVVRVLSNSADKFAEKTVEQALLLADVSFVNIDGEEIVIHKGTEVVVDLDKKIACNADGVQFEIFPEEYQLLSLN